MSKRICTICQDEDIEPKEMLTIYFYGLALEQFLRDESGKMKIHLCIGCLIKLLNKIKNNAK